MLRPAELGICLSSSNAQVALNTPDAAQTDPLPRLAASSLLTEDSDVVLTAADELVVDDPAAAEAAVPRCSKGCQSCCPCTCCCPSLWEISAGAVILHRDRQSAGTIIGAFPAGSPAFTRGSDFDFGWNVGPSIAIARRIAGSNNFLEARYFNSYGSASVQFVTPGNFIGAGFTGPGGTAILGTDLTKLDSTEINWRHQRWNRLSLLAGFRWIELKDDVQYRIGSTALGDYNFHNHLYGGQLGADWALTDPSNRLQLRVVGKVGVYGNVNDGGITQAIGGSPVNSFSGQGYTTSFVGDSAGCVHPDRSHRHPRRLSVALAHQFKRRAGDAANRSLVNPALLTTASDDGHLFYQGVTAGIDFTW